MPYHFVDRNRRLRSRADVSGSLTHLTRSKPVDSHRLSAVQILVQILRERRLRGSTTESGFIVGPTPAVCLFDSPLYSICEHLDFEYESNRQPPRYEAAGLMLPKEYVYNRNGRPVVYERRDVAKAFLPKDEWWRIVNFDLARERLVDWTHEREWRVPGDLELDLGQVTVVVGNREMYRQFCAESGADILKSVGSVVDLSALYV